MNWEKVDKVALRVTLGLVGFLAVYLGCHILLVTVQ
jgi:hypothetical protein